MIRAKLTDLHKRLVVSLVSIVILSGLVIFFDQVVVKTLLVLCVAAFAGIGVWEYAQFAKAKQLRPAVVAMIIVAVCEVFAFFAAHKLIVFAQKPAIVLAIGAVAFFLIHFKDISDALVHVSVEFFGVCYVSVPLSFMLAILYPMSADGTSWDGRWWLVYLILVTKITDVAAYFVGRLWGRVKLAPLLSPKKTVEGAVAGVICAIVCSVFMSVVGGWIDSPLFDLPMLSAVILGACVGIAGEFGDLSESLLKRDAVVKDSNNLPGLGGILDMVDSLLLTAPIVYFYLKLQG